MPRIRSRCNHWSLRTKLARRLGILPASRRDPAQHRERRLVFESHATCFAVHRSCAAR